MFCKQLVWYVWVCPVELDSDSQSMKRISFKFSTIISRFIFNELIFSASWLIGSYGALIIVKCVCY